MKVKYTITIIREEIPEGWSARTKNEAIKNINEFLKENGGSYLEDCDWDSITVEEI